MTRVWIALSLPLMVAACSAADEDSPAGPTGNGFDDAALDGTTPDGAARDGGVTDTGGLGDDATAPDTSIGSDVGAGDAGTAKDTGTASDVAAVHVLPSSWSIKLGETKLFAVVARDASGATLSLAGRTITWSSSNTGVATINGSGLATSTGAGLTTITCAVDGQKGTAKLQVNALVPAASAVLTPSALDLAVGDLGSVLAVPLDATGTPVSGHAATYKSSNPSVATTYSNGTVKALAAGTATLTATVGGRTATSVVHVYTTLPSPGTSTIEILPHQALLETGQNRTVSVFLYDATGAAVSLTGKTVTVTSSKPGIVEVSSSGPGSWVAAAKSPGIAQLTATVDGVSGTATFYVAAPY